MLNIGNSKFYRLKNILDNSIPEQNRTEYYYYTNNNKFFVTEKGLSWFKDNLSNFSNLNNKSSSNNNSNDITLYQNQIIDIYKKRIEYLENENKRLLDIISLKEQKEIAKDVKIFKNSDSLSFWDKFFHKLKK